MLPLAKVLLGSIEELTRERNLALGKIAESMEQIGQAVHELSAVLIAKDVEGPRLRARGYVERALESLRANAPEDARINLARAMAEDPSYMPLWVATVGCRALELLNAHGEAEAPFTASNEDVQTALKAVRYVTAAEIPVSQAILHLTALTGVASIYGDQRIAEEAARGLAGLIANPTKVEFGRSCLIVSDLRQINPDEHATDLAADALAIRYRAGVGEVRQWMRLQKAGDPTVAIRVLRIAIPVVSSEDQERGRAMEADVRSYLELRLRKAALQRRLGDLPTFTVGAWMLLAGAACFALAMGGMFLPPLAPFVLLGEFGVGLPPVAVVFLLIAAAKRRERRRKEKELEEIERQIARLVG